jgi:hypothetical protein
VTVYQPLFWSNLRLPAQTGSVRLVGDIPLNIANQIKLAAPTTIRIDSAQPVVYPLAVVLRRMDFEILRLQADFQKKKSATPDLPDPAHFTLRLKLPDQTVLVKSIVDIGLPAPTAAKPAKSASPFALDLDYAYQGVSVSEFEIERSRAGAQATAREYIFDLLAHFKDVQLTSGTYEAQLETWALASNWVVTQVEVGAS